MEMGDWTHQQDYTQTGPNGHATAGLETTLAMPCGVSTTARQDLLSQSLLKSAPLLCPQASAVALAFFMAFLMARPLMAFITLLTFFTFFMAAFIAPPFMADFFMAAAFFIAPALFMAAIVQTMRNTAGGRKGSCSRTL